MSIEEFSVFLLFMITRILLVCVDQILHLRISKLHVRLPIIAEMKHLHDTWTIYNPSINSMT